MFDAAFDLPLVLVGIAILILLCLFALSGPAIFSRHILPRLKLGPEESVLTSAMMQPVMVPQWRQFMLASLGVVRWPAMES